MKSKSKNNDIMKKVFLWIFIISTIWLLGRTAVMYEVYLSFGARPRFDGNLSFKECFQYMNYDKVIFAVQMVSLFIIIVRSKLHKA